MLSAALVRGLLAAAFVSLTGACRASGSFLIFGGPSAPQDRLVASVRSAEKELEETQEDFTDAFRLYQRLSSPQAVELEELSEDFADAVEACEERAADLGERIESVRREKETLIQGWSSELASFSSETLRKKSAAMMQETEARAQRVLASLERVHERMQPVLLKLQDYALFFHHNLNARAIATLEDTYRDFDAESRALESELGKCREESAAFLGTLAEPVPAPVPAPPPAKK